MPGGRSGRFPGRGAAAARWAPECREALEPRPSRAPRSSAGTGPGRWPRSTGLGCGPVAPRSRWRLLHSPPTPFIYFVRFLGALHGLARGARLSLSLLQAEVLCREECKLQEVWRFSKLLRRAHRSSPRLRSVQPSVVKADDDAQGLALSLPGLGSP